MSTAQAITALATGMLWRATHVDRLAGSLVDMAASDDEDTSTMAMMMLTKGGNHAVPVVRAAIENGRHELVDVLVSIGDDDAREALRQLAHDAGDPQVAAAATAGLARLNRARRKQT